MSQARQATAVKTSRKAAAAAAVAARTEAGDGGLRVRLAGLRRHSGDQLLRAAEGGPKEGAVANACIAKWCVGPTRGPFGPVRGARYH